MKTKLWIALAFFTTFVLGFASGYWVPKPPPAQMEDYLIKDLSEQSPDTPLDSSIVVPPRQGPPPSGQDKPFATRQQMNPREKAQRERLAQLLELREDQKPAFDSSSRAFHEQMNRTLQETRMQTRKKIMAQNDSLDRQMREILDPKQYERWKKFHLRRQRLLEQRQHFMDSAGPRQPRM